jgi:hypothetical protein
MAIQNGYGFVHFPADYEGIQSALNVVKYLNKATVNEILFDCNLSNKSNQFISSMPEFNPNIRTSLSQQASPQAPTSTLPTNLHLPHLTNSMTGFTAQQANDNSMTSVDAQELQQLILRLQNSNQHQMSQGNLQGMQQSYHGQQKSSSIQQQQQILLQQNHQYQALLQQNQQNIQLQQFLQHQQSQAQIQKSPVDSNYDRSLHFPKATTQPGTSSFAAVNTSMPRSPAENYANFTPVTASRMQLMNPALNMSGTGNLNSPYSSDRNSSGSSSTLNLQLQQQQYAGLMNTKDATNKAMPTPSSTSISSISSDFAMTAAQMQQRTSFEGFTPSPSIRDRTNTRTNLSNSMALPPAAPAFTIPQNSQYNNGLQQQLFQQTSHWDSPAGAAAASPASGYAGLGTGAYRASNQGHAYPANITIPNVNSPSNQTRNFGGYGNMTAASTTDAKTPVSYYQSPAIPTNTLTIPGTNSWGNMTSNAPTPTSYNTMPNTNIGHSNVVDPSLMFTVQTDFPSNGNSTYQPQSTGATPGRGMTSKKTSKRAMMVLKEFQHFDHTNSSAKADKQSSSYLQTGVTDNNGFSDDSSDSDRHADGLDGVDGSFHDPNRDVNKTLPRLISGMSMHSAAETVSAFDDEHNDVHDMNGSDFSHHQNKFEIDDIIDQPNDQYDDYYPVKPSATSSNTSYPNAYTSEGNAYP